MASDIVTGVCRASYVHVAEKYAPPAKAGEEQQEPKYSIMLLLPKSDTATYEKLREIEKSTAKSSKVFNGKVPPKLVSIIQDGDGENQEGESIPDKFPERAGHWFFSVRSKTRPGVVNAAKERIDPEEIYSGCYVRAALSCFAYEYRGKRGVSFGLNNLQFVKDGEAFGAVTAPEDDFDEFDDELI